MEPRLNGIWLLMTGDECSFRQRRGNKDAAIFRARQTYACGLALLQPTYTVTAVMRRIS